MLAFAGINPGLFLPGGVAVGSAENGPETGNGTKWERMGGIPSHPFPEPTSLLLTAVLDFAAPQYPEQNPVTLIALSSSLLGLCPLC